MSELLRVNTVSKAYPGESLGAVNEVSFAMDAGEIFSLVGESGSGKSTLLRMLAGLLKPDTGSIYFQDEPLTNPEEQLIAGHPAIKMVFQDFDLMPNMTVAENLRYPLLTYDKGYQQKRVGDLLNLCRIQEFADKLPRELSGGQQQRVALARALADEPALLLMDEPFSQLDPVNKRLLLEEVLRILKAEQVALVLVTHDTKDALMISDRIGFLQKGSILQTGTPEDLYNRPVNLDVATFFGIVNLFSNSEIEDYLGTIKPEQEPDELKMLGVRAEHIALANGSKEKGLMLKFEKQLFLGDRYLVYCKLAQDKQIAFFNSQSLTGVKDIRVHFEQERLLFFYT